MVQRAVPTRSCVHCRASRAKRELLRVIRTPEGGVAYDPSGKANGRGAYVCHDQACIVGAIGRAGLARALGTSLPVTLADELQRAVNRGTADGTE